MESLGLDHATIKTSTTDRELLFIKKTIVDLFELGSRFMEEGVYKFPLIDKSNFINYIEIKEKYGKGHYLIIDFNYPRYFSESNFHLLYKQTQKKEVDDYLKKLAIEILDLREIRINYMILEIAGQLYVKRFSDFYKVINLLARAKANYISRGPTCNFMYLSKQLQREFIKGFTSKITPGLKNTQYDKTQEHNLKNSDKKLGQELRNEYKITEKMLKTIFGTNDVEELDLSFINSKFAQNQKNIIEDSIRKQLFGDINILQDKLKKLERISPKNIEIFVTEFDEYIFDYKIIANILKKELKDKKSESMIKKYQKSARDKMRELENSNSPVRKNIGNIKRLTEYLNVFYNIKFEMKITENEDFQLFFH